MPGQVSFRIILMSYCYLICLWNWLRIATSACTCSGNSKLVQVLALKLEIISGALDIFLRYSPEICMFAPFRLYCGNFEYIRIIRNSVLVVNFINLTKRTDKLIDLTLKLCVILWSNGDHIMIEIIYIIMTHIQSIIDSIKNPNGLEIEIVIWFS